MVDILSAAGIWLAAFLTLAVSTIYWKDNPFGRFGEHVWVGAVLGNIAVLGLKAVYDMGIVRILGGSYVYLVGIIAGLLVFARYSRPYRWLSVYPAAFLVGIGVGISARAIPSAQIIAQISAAIASPLVRADLVTSISSVVAFFATISTIYFFTFTVKTAVSGKVPETIRTIARYFLMIAFGATFATVVVTRFNQYAGRVMFLLFEWLGLG